MRIAFFVNAVADEYPNYATTVLGHEAQQRGHDVVYVEPGDFVLTGDDALQVHARAVPTGEHADHRAYFETVRAMDPRATELVDVRDIDVLMLRSDPSNEVATRPWAEDIGVLFGREAAKRGALVLNDPGGLAGAANKLYFESFPKEVRAEALITRNAADVKAFADKHNGSIILKPLQGSGGSGVFKVDPANLSNLNQMIEAIERDGYIIAQAYVPAASEGDIRLFIMNGRPLERDGKFCALRRVAAEGDIRSNLHAGGRVEPAEVGETELRLAELIRPKLIADGMFLVGIDIVGDKILEVNVFSPGGLASCSELAGVPFGAVVIEAIERKVKIKRDFSDAFDNRALASL